MKPDGGSLIGFGSSGLGGGSFKAYDPAKNTLIEPTFTSADTDDVERATQLAAAAAPVLARLSGAARGKFLRTIAANPGTRPAALVAAPCRKPRCPRPG